MLHGEALGVLVGAIALGAVHGIEPGHGWPVAASYAIDRPNKWFYGFAASFIIGVGHLISSIAMVLVFFYAKDYFSLTQANEPITVLGNVQIGGPVSLVAGVLLIGLGIREYTHGHSHGHSESDDGAGEADSHGVHDTPQDHEHAHHDDHGHPHTRGHGHTHGQAEDHGSDHAHDGDSYDNAHDHAHDKGHGHAHDKGHDHAHDKGHDHAHDKGHDHGEETVWARVTGFIPFVGGHSHEHENMGQAADRGLLGIAWFAFVLGFAHEEEFEIIALCAGSNYCLELMGAYATTVIFGIVGLTLLLIAGYQHYEESVEEYTPYLPAFSAAVLVIMGFGFITGLF